MGAGSHTYSDLEKTVTQVLLGEMESLGLNQAQLVARTGIPKGSLSKIFQNKMPLGIDRFDAICCALDLSPSTVLARAEEILSTTAPTPTSVSAPAPDSAPAFSSQPDWSKIDLTALAALDPGYSPQDQIDGEAQNYA